MSTLPILEYPNDSLTTEAAKVGEIAPAIRRLITSMIATMRASKGVGLAAPQVGQSLRIAVLEHAPGLDEDQGTAVPLQVLINPKIISTTGGSQTSDEGCLSLPGIEVSVPRARRIKVRATNEHGETVQFRAVGFHARIIQHELDHLARKLIIDYAKNRSKLLAEYEKKSNVKSQRSK